MRGAGAATALCVALLIVSCEAAYRGDLSLSGPHDRVDAHGDRELSNYAYGGNSAAFKHFVRLTPDRQSKSGWTWSRTALGLDELSLVWKFRISGQGRTLFGDGIALWLTPNTNDGVVSTATAFHGGPSRFTGVAIVVDTFRNAETAHAHRDVAVLVSDGTRLAQDIVNVATTAELPGCDADVRYHETRADFSVFNVSRLRLSIKDSSMQVDIDSRGSGAWTPCATVSLAALPAGWMRGAKIGVTAATGQLADNHDVVGVSVYDTAADATDGTCAAPDSLPERLEALQHELEHKLEAVRDALTASLNKLKAAEELDSGRIKQLEALHLDRLAEHDAKQESRIAALEARVDTKVSEQLSTRLARVESLNDQKLDARIRALEAHIAGTVASASGQWRVPMGVLFCLGVVFALVVWRKFVAYRKLHLL